MRQLQNIPLTKKSSCHEKKPRLIYPECFLPFLKSHPPLPSVEVKNESSYKPTPPIFLHGMGKENYISASKSTWNSAVCTSRSTEQISTYLVLPEEILRVVILWRTDVQFEGGQDVQLKWQQVLRISEKQSCFRVAKRKQETTSLLRNERDILDQQVFRKTLLRTREVVWGCARICGCNAARVRTSAMNNVQGQRSAKPYMTTACKINRIWQLTWNFVCLNFVRATFLVI
jgi:hypothetical protein